MTETEILLKIKDAYRDILKEKLVGIYVHGSIAFGCFRWDRSDIDFIVVVNEKLNRDEKVALISTLLLLDKDCPPKGLEMSVVLENVCKPFVYPTPYELHFSNFHKERFKVDLAGHAENMNGLDKDLAAHFTVIHEVGQVLCGKPIAEVFGEVPKENYLDSICEDIKEAENDVADNPVYFILNLCRVLAYIEDGIVLSKKQGGEWGVQNLPAKFTEVVEKALAGYCTEVEWNDISEKRLKEIQEFVGYMMKRIIRR